MEKVVRNVRYGVTYELHISDPLYFVIVLKAMYKSFLRT